MNIRTNRIFIICLTTIMILSIGAGSLMEKVRYLAYLDSLVGVVPETLSEVPEDSISPVSFLRFAGE